MHVWPRGCLTRRTRTICSLALAQTLSAAVCFKNDRHLPGSLSIVQFLQLPSLARLEHRLLVSTAALTVHNRDSNAEEPHSPGSSTQGARAVVAGGCVPGSRLQVNIKSGKHQSYRNIQTCTLFLMCVKCTGNSGCKFKRHVQLVDVCMIVYGALLVAMLVVCCVCAESGRV